MMYRLFPDLDDHIDVLVSRGYTGDPEWRRPLSREDILSGKQGQKWNEEYRVQIALAIVKAASNVRLM